MSFSAGSGKVAGTVVALISHPPISHSPADACSSDRPSAGSATQLAHSCDANITSANDRKPDNTGHKEAAPKTALNERQPVAGHCTAPAGTHAGTAGATGSTEELVQDQAIAPGAADEDFSVPNAEEDRAPDIPASSESNPQLTVLLGEELKTASCSTVADEISAEGQSEPLVIAMSRAGVTSSTDERVDASAADSASTSMLLPPGEPPATGESSADLCDNLKADISQSAANIPVPRLNLHGSDIQPEPASMPPAHRHQLSGQPSNGVSSAHQRQLSGESSKGNALSGNPYASSCGDSRAGSMGGSPAGSLAGPDNSQTHLQHELSGAVSTPAMCLRCSHAAYGDTECRHAER